MRRFRTCAAALARRSHGASRCGRCKTSRRAKFLLPHADQLFDALQKEARDGPPPQRPLDEDLPGLGQHYCNISGRARRVPPPRGPLHRPARGPELAHTCDTPSAARARRPPACARSRFFQSAEALATFRTTKAYKRLLKRRAEQPHTQADADAAAGMGRPHNG